MSNPEPHGFMSSADALKLFIEREKTNAATIADLLRRAEHDTFVANEAERMTVIGYYDAIRKALQDANYAEFGKRVAEIMRDHSDGRYAMHHLIEAVGEIVEAANKIGIELEK